MQKPQTVTTSEAAQGDRRHAAGCAVGLLALMFLVLSTPSRATTAPTPSGMDWKCYETCRQEECTDNSLWCVATCLLACYYPPDEPNGGGSAFVDVLERVTDLVIKLEATPPQPLEDLLPPLRKSLERYQHDVRGR